MSKLERALGVSAVTRQVGAQGKPAARDRILLAAARRFASASYEEVSLRDIAGDVGVDVAYVHRSYGSKANLFEAALQAASGGTPLDDLGGVGRDAFAAALVARLVEKEQQRPIDGVDPMDIIIRSLASRNASDVLRDKARREFLQPIARRLEDQGELRASTIIALLMGFGIARDLLRLDPLVATENETQMRQLLEAAIDALAKTPLDAPS